jgi:RHS repeat-associated protein
VQDNNDGIITKYQNGLGIDNKLKMVTNGQAKYFLQDHLGSTTALTNSSGNITESASYDAFGNATVNLTTRYSYTGREYDSDIGLQYSRARWYSSELGRFISEDPIGFAGGDVNLYGYVKNNPLKYRDPRGLDDADKPWYIDTYPSLYPTESNGLPTTIAWDAQRRTFPENEYPDPYGGAYRHCVAACVVGRRAGPFAGIIIGTWDFFAEDPDDLNSITDMSGEIDGLACRNGNDTCEKGCLLKYPPFN